MATTLGPAFLPVVFSSLALAGSTSFWQPPAFADEQPRTDSSQGRLHGRLTDATTGKPVAGAKVKVLIQGVAGKPAITEEVSDADGRYALAVPFGHANVWGVFAPAGYYTQDPKTFSAFVTTAAEPNVVRDFVLQTGSPWQVEVQGVFMPLDKPAHFSAFPQRQNFAHGETISVTGDGRGKGVLTIPTAGGNYRFTGGLGHSPPKYEFPVANLEVDKEFDPRRIAGDPEPLADRKAVRLRDAAGRVAVIEGAEVRVESGRAVLRFQAQQIPTFSAVVFRGNAVDETGKPVAGARFTAAFRFERSAFMTHLEATTDAQGKFEMNDVLLPQSLFGVGSTINMVVVKSGLHAAETKPMSLLEVKQNGGGDFGTVVLHGGRTLRGKVVDENARPVHGAVVTNMTNYFLYGNLQCRTDSKGEFVMPDLSYGNQKISAEYGERSGERKFEFDAQSGECVITVRSPR